jgi:hypothetical protein
MKLPFFIEKMRAPCHQPPDFLLARLFDSSAQSAPPGGHSNPSLSLALFSSLRVLELYEHQVWKAARRSKKMYSTCSYGVLTCFVLPHSSFKRHTPHSHA